MAGIYFPLAKMDLAEVVLGQMNVSLCCSLVVGVSLLYEDEHLSYVRIQNRCK
jgi:hypothetical protein